MWQHVAWTGDLCASGMPCVRNCMQLQWHLNNCNESGMPRMAGIPCATEEEGAETSGKTSVSRSLLSLQPDYSFKSGSQVIKACRTHWTFTTIFLFKCWALARNHAEPNELWQTESADSKHRTTLLWCVVLCSKEEEEEREEEEKEEKEENKLSSLSLEKGTGATDFSPLYGSISCWCWSQMHPQIQGADAFPHIHHTDVGFGPSLCHHKAAGLTGQGVTSRFVRNVRTSRKSPSYMAICSPRQIVVSH